MKNTSCLKNVTISQYKNLLITKDSLSEGDSMLLSEISNEINETLESSSFVARIELFRNLAYLQFEWSVLQWQEIVATHVENQIKQVEFEISSLDGDKEQEISTPEKEEEEFIQWVIEVERFMGISIDQDAKDMYYFIQQTKNMKKHYDAQIKSLNRR